MNSAFTRALAAGVLLLGGCAADLRWSKPGADAPAVSRDLDACRANALTHAGPQGAGVPSHDGQALDRGANAMSTRASGMSSDRFIAEHEDVRLCMLRQGYQLR